MASIRTEIAAGTVLLGLADSDVQAQLHEEGRRLLELAGKHARGPLFEVAR